MTTMPTGERAKAVRDSVERRNHACGQPRDMRRERGDAYGEVEGALGAGRMRGGPVSFRRRSMVGRARNTVPLHIRVGASVTRHYAGRYGGIRDARVLLVVRGLRVDALEQAEVGGVHGGRVREAEDGDELVPEHGELLRRERARRRRACASGVSARGWRFKGMRGGLTVHEADAAADAGEGELRRGLCGARPGGRGAGGRGGGGGRGEGRGGRGAGHGRHAVLREGGREERVVRGGVARLLAGSARGSAVAVAVAEGGGVDSGRVASGAGESGSGLCRVRVGESGGGGGGRYKGAASRIGRVFGHEGRGGGASLGRRAGAGHEARIE